MNFSTDRDLLAFEPTLFHDVPWTRQQRVNADDALLSGTTLVSMLADFEAAQVEAGGVVLIANIAYEVIARDDAHTLTVSLLRARLSDPPIPGPDSVEALTLVARTFAPQAALVHDGLLRLVGVGTSVSPAEPALGEDAIISLSVMARLEALGTLERIYSGAVALIGDNQLLQFKAGEYRRRFRHAVSQASVLLDADGDGHADERRRLGVVRFTRV